MVIEKKGFITPGEIRRANRQKKITKITSDGGGKVLSVILAEETAPLRNPSNQW